MRVLTFVLVFFVYTLFFSQLSIGAESRAEDHDALRALMKSVVVAMNNKDVPMLMDCLAKDFAVTTIDQETLTSSRELEDYFKKSFNAPGSIVTDLKISPEADVLTKFTGDSSGFCYGKNTETYAMRDGRKVEMESRWTATLVKEDGPWKIAAIHAGVNFIKNPVTEKLGAAIPKAAVFSFLSGILAVFVIRFILVKVKSGKK